MTTNPFFTPTQYGAEDACRLLNAEYQWTGSVNSVVAEMVDATNTAITGKADGVALAVVDQNAFRDPVDRALDAGIPVVSYNADGSRDDPGTNRLAYIGQGLYESGYALGQRALTQIDSGAVAGFIATPGQLNIQPRIDGAQQAFRDSGKSINFEAIATNADITQGLSIIDAYVQGHQNVAGLLAVDAGSTQSVGQMVAKYQLRGKGLKVAGGFDLVPETLNSVKAGDLDYTIDQQPYLQGFLPVSRALPLQGFRWSNFPDADKHRAPLRHQGQRRPVPEHQDPIRGVRHGAQARSQVRRDRARLMWVHRAPPVTAAAPGDTPLEAVCP